jgi:hypothetical protein
MGNPFAKRPAIADEIIQAPDLQPQAQIVGAKYAAPTVRNVAQVPKENQLEQLAAGLAEINPAIQQFVGMSAKKYTASEIARGEADQLKNKTAYADLVRSGEIAPGQSRAYEDAYLTQEVKKHADQFAPALTSAWSQSGVSQLDAPPGAFDTFANDFAQKWNTDHLTKTGADGTTIQKYSPLQLHDAGYSTTQNAAIAHLAAHDTNVVIDERTKKGEDVVASNVQSFLNDALTGPDGNLLEPHARDLTTFAAKTADLIKSMTATGMATSKATENVILGIRQTAIDHKDPSILRDGGAAIDASRDKFAAITKTRGWMGNGPVREHIANLQQSEINAKEARLQLIAKGETEEERSKLYKLEHDAHTGALTESMRQIRTTVLRDAVMGAVKDAAHPTPAELATQKDKLFELKQHDGTAGDAVEQTLYMREHPKQLERTKQAQDVSEMELSRQVMEHPTSPQTSEMIDYALRHEQISGDAHRRLQGMQDDVRGPMKVLVNDPIMRHAIQAIHDGAIPHLEAVTGRESESAGLAENQAWKEAFAYAKSHPEKTPSEVAEFMLKHRGSPIIESYNLVRADEVKQAKIQKQITDLALKETDVQAIQAHTKIARQKNSHGEWFRQGPDEELQVMKAQAQTELIQRQDAENAKNAAGILKEGHDAARRFNGKDPAVADQPANFDHLNTRLSPANEAKFSAWKKVYALRDSGQDYDLRGAFKAGITPDTKTGHWPDTFKLPNHPTFSDESQYAKYGNPGHWNGDTFVPAAPGAELERIRAEFKRRDPKASSAQIEAWASHMYGERHPPAQ